MAPDHKRTLAFQAVAVLACATGLEWFDGSQVRAVGVMAVALLLWVPAGMWLFPLPADPDTALPAPRPGLARRAGRAFVLGLLGYLWIALLLWMLYDGKPLWRLGLEALFLVPFTAALLAALEGIGTAWQRFRIRKGWGPGQGGIDVGNDAS